MEVKLSNQQKIPRQVFEAILSGAFEAMRRVLNTQGGVSRAVTRNKKSLQDRQIAGTMSDEEIQSKLNITKTLMKGGAEGLAFAWLILLDPIEGATNKGTKHLLRTYMQRGNKGLMVWD